MKLFLALSILALSLAVTNAAENHSKHHEKHHSKEEEEKRHAVKSLSLNNGKKWDVDQTMRENMEAINKQFTKFKALVASKKANAKDYSELGHTISTSAQNIANNCNMEQKKDETFHTVLGDLLASADALKDPKHAEHAAKKLDHALKTYTEYFDHAFSK